VRGGGKSETKVCSMMGKNSVRKEKGSKETNKQTTSDFFRRIFNLIRLQTFCLASATMMLHLDDFNYYFVVAKLNCVI
jgi:hypothetical protein